MASNKYYGDINLSEDERELADFYDSCTNCHAYDERGTLYGKMVIEVEYGGFANSIQVLSADIHKVKYDPLDE